MERCIHELDVISCADCKPRNSKDQMVYATPGGSVVHRRADCEMLARGQSAVDSMGGRIGSINLVDRNRYPGRGDCAWCMSDAEIGSCKVSVDDAIIDAIVINRRPLGYGHLAYLVRYTTPEGSVIEVQMKKSQLFDLHMKRDSDE